MLSTIKKLLQGGERTEGGDTLYNWYTNTTKKKEETSKVSSSSWLFLIISLHLTLMKIIVLVTLPPHSTFSPFLTLLLLSLTRPPSLIFPSYTHTPSVTLPPLTPSITLPCHPGSPPSSYSLLTLPLPTLPHTSRYWCTTATSTPHWRRWENWGSFANGPLVCSLLADTWCSMESVTTRLSP